MAVLLTPPKLQFFDNDGNPLAGGKVYTYTATGGTFTTKKATYTTEEGNIENDNPITLDAAGMADIWIVGSYDIKVTDSQDALLYTQLNVSAFTTLPPEGTAFFESFSGNGTQTSFTMPSDLGTDEKTLLVWVDNTNRNYVTNPNFDTDTGWTKGSGWTISGNVANASSASSAISQTAPFTLTQYQNYTLTYTMTQSGGTLTPSIGGTSGTTRSSAGTYTETIICGSTQTIAFTGASFDGTLDSIILRKANSEGYNILPPSAYTIDGTDLTLTSPPANASNNILVFDPSTLVGAASSAAAAAEASAAEALESEQAAAAYAAMLTGTSTTSNSITTGTKNFTTQADKFFEAGNWLLITSDANPTNYMHGEVTTYSGTALTMNIIDTGGSGTHTDWTIRLSGTQGAKGDTGSISGATDIIAATSAGINLQNNSSVTVLNVGSSGGTGATFSGTLSMSNNKINNVTDPTSAQDAATKAYVDAAITTAISNITQQLAVGWVAFNGITGNVLSSKNITINKVSTGNYDLTSSVTFAAANYTVIGTTSTTNPAGIVEVDVGTLFTTTQVRIVTKEGLGNTPADFSYVAVVLFGVLA